MKNPYEQALQQYKSIELQTSIEAASPHELIDLMLKSARSHIATAQGHLQRKEISDKGMHIGKTISIIDGLKSCLDHGRGGDIASNLDNLYNYIQQILLRANLDNNIEFLIEANHLLATIHEGWQGIKSQIKD